MPRPIHVTINPNALVHNYQQAKRLAANAKVWAVLKARAYGHGIEIAGAALRQLADGFAVLDLSEAIDLRRIGCTQPILLLEGVFNSEDVLVAQNYNLELMVINNEQINLIERTLRQLPDTKALYASVKVKSNMNRLGFTTENAVAAWTRLMSINGIEPSRWVVHFPNADASMVDSEKECRLEISETLAMMNKLMQSYPATLCAANSAAIMQHANSHANEVRAGIMLYGSCPVEGKNAEYFGLRPTMSFNSEVIALQTITAGESIGYGSRFVANTPMTIAIIACGYADGYPRQAIDGTPVAVAGVECPLVGRVSMDMLVVDVTNISQVMVGTKVELWGENISVDRVASFADTISYTLFCAITARVGRRIAA